jgi:hypothetical protein
MPKAALGVPGLRQPGSGNAVAASTANASWGSSTSSSLCALPLNPTAWPRLLTA